MEGYTNRIESEENMEMEKAEKEETLADYLKRKAKIEQKLMERGITAADMPLIMSLLGDIRDTTSTLTTLRAKQFYDDAYDLVYEMKSGSRGNIEKLATFLRQFAEHVASHAIEQYRTDMTIETIVDHIPQMHEDSPGETAS